MHCNSSRRLESNAKQELFRKSQWQHVCVWLCGCSLALNKNGFVRIVILLQYSLKNNSTVIWDPQNIRNGPFITINMKTNVRSTDTQVPNVRKATNPQRMEIKITVIIINYSLLIYLFILVIVSPQLFNVDHWINTTSLINSSNSCYSLIFCIRSNSFSGIGWEMPSIIL